MTSDTGKLRRRASALPATYIDPPQQPPCTSPSLCRSFGIVWKGVFRLNPVAIKTCRITKVTARVVCEFMGELKLMAPLSHENLVILVGGCWSDGPDKLCLVLEFCGRGTLRDLLEATATHKLKHDWGHPFYQITMGIASCFRYFHHEQPSGEALLHRDLKSENVLIDEGFKAKVRRPPPPRI